MKALTTAICLTIAVFLGSVGIAYALPPCPLSGYYDNCFGTSTYANGDEYVGEYRNNKFHGRGTYTFLTTEAVKTVFKQAEALATELSAKAENA